MLPIFRIISVGGVTLAITILALALIPPGGTRLVRAQHDVVARGPLMDPGTHPEWRQFLIHAALRRAGELERLRDLRDTIVRAPDVAVPDPEIVVEIPAPPAARQFAGLPSGNADSEDETTGSIGNASSTTIPIEIGAASSTELPVITTEEAPPAIRLPALQLLSIEPTAAPTTVEPPAVNQPVKQAEKRRVVQPRSRRRPPTPAEPQPLPPPFNILAAIFGSLARAESTGQPSAPTANNGAQPPRNRQAWSTRAVNR